MHAILQNTVALFVVWMQAQVYVGMLVCALTWEGQSALWCCPSGVPLLFLLFGLSVDRLALNSESCLLLAQQC